MAASGLDRSIASLHQQTLRPVEIIVVDDGSTDETRAVAERARALGMVDMVICHGTRCGRSAAINAAARFASGDLLLTVDADTVFEPTAVARLAAAFDDPRVGGASCNIAISNEGDIDMDRTSKHRVSDVDQRRASPCSTSRARSPACPAPVPCIGATRSCARAAWTSARGRIWSTACGCVASAISSASCRTPGRKQTARQPPSASCGNARAGTAMLCASVS